MTAPPSGETDRDFWTLAGELGMIGRDEAQALSEETRTGGQPAAQVAIRSGALSAMEIDIVETLLRPTEAAPGYEVLEILGRGGMGVVYRARQQNLGRLVALKTMLVRDKNDPTLAVRFEREARVVAQLRHPNIVSAYDFGRHAGRLYFVMEYLEGENLETLLVRRGALDEATAWGVIRQAAAGLAHAAQHGVVHRDVKPANLLLVEPPTGFQLPPGVPMVKVADFGLAFLDEDSEARTRLTSAQSAMGSPHYMAPEQLDGGHVDARTDIYALGASAFHVLAGEPPFAEMRLGQILAAKVTAESPDVRSLQPHVSGGAADLVREMMARDPARRPGDYRLLLQRIDALAGGGGRSAQSESLAYRLPPNGGGKTTWTEGPTAATLELPRLETATAVELPPGPPPRRSQRRLALVIAALALIIAAGAAVAWRLRERGPPLADRQFQKAVWSAPLFDGRTLDGWRILEGGWDPVATPAGNVLTSSRGVLARRLVRFDLKDRPPLEHFRATVLVDRREAAAAEVRFGVAPAARRPPRLALRLTADGAQLIRSEEGGEVETLSALRPAAGAEDDFHVVRIERQVEWWWVFFDERLLGVAAIEAQTGPADLALVAEGGTAWFSDLTIEALERSAAPPTANEK